MVRYLVFIILMLAIPASASVNTFDIHPSHPYQGDTVVIEGYADPNEDVPITVMFRLRVPVEGGEFKYYLYDVNIPTSNNRFTVSATNCEKLDVSVKILIWLTKSSEGSGGTATVSQSNVPPGTYDIRIKGDAVEGASYSDLTITAWTSLKADSSGYFTYSYNTKPIPPGTFELRVGGMSRIITLESVEALFGSEEQKKEEIVETNQTNTTVETTNLTETNVNNTSQVAEGGKAESETENKKPTLPIEGILSVVAILMTYFVLRRL
jgi:hypothetical protein